MKSIYSSLIFLILIGLSGCMDELEKDPIGLLTLDQIDTNPTEATIESAVYSSYQALTSTLNAIVPGWQWSMGTVFRNDVILQDIASNDMNKKWNPDGDQAWMDELSDFSFTPENQAFNGIWVYNFEGINRVNLAISYLTDNEIVQATGISSARKDQLLGEAYFLRAFYYFDLVNNFGGVPLILKPSSSFDEALSVAVRVEANEVWAQINEDLAAARSAIPDGKYPSPDQKWRVSLGVILAMQAKVALFEEQWQEVIDRINDLDALGYYDLNSNYFDSFDANKKFAENEVIFAYDHRSNEIPNNNNGLRYVAGWGFFAPTDDFINAFEENDPRLDYTVDIANKMPRKIVGSVSEWIDYGNRIYIRYADVLLWKAEALNETGNTAAAVEILNQIRARVRNGVTPEGNPVPEGTLADRELTADKALINDWIRNERRVELGFESHRFNDLKRWGVAKQVLSGLGRNFQDHHYLYPIPQNDIDKSGGTITQNDGY